MAYCVSCGNKLSESDRFCSNCGTAVEETQAPDKKRNSREQLFDGKIYKCPNCGEQLESFSATCPACGYELRGSQVTSCVHELSQKLECTETAEKRIELIRNFYIPNTKEDIYEFFILAYSNITAGAQGIDAWKVKLEQAYLKAKLAFDNGEDFKHIDELYKQIKKASIKSKFLKSRLFKSLVIFITGLILMLIGFLIPAIFSIEDNNICGPLYFIGMVGMLPFVVGLIMLIIPEKRNKSKNIT